LTDPHSLISLTLNVQSTMVRSGLVHELTARLTKT